MATETDRSTALDELRRLMAKQIVDWKPEKPGDNVLGVVVSLTEVDGAHSRFPVVELDVGEHLARVACGRSVLESEIRSRDIREGDLLGIEYLGEKATVAGTKNYHAYRVVHRAQERHEPPRLTNGDDAGYDPGEETF